MKFINGKIFITSLLFAISIWFFFMAFKSPAVWEYSEIARNIIEHHRFSYRHFGVEYLCFCPPLYPFLVAFIYLVSNYNDLAVIFVQMIIYSLLCVVIFNIGKNIFGTKTGIIASILLMVHPGIIFYVLRHEHSLILDAFMFALSVCCILGLYDKSGSFKKAMICGVILGLSFLSRGTALILLPLFMAWIVLTFKLSIKRRLFLAFFIALVSILTILPWTIRNYAVTKKIMLIGAVSEECLWRGNNPNASGSSYDAAGKIISRDLRGKDLLEKIYATDEIGQKEIFEKEAFSFIKNNPWKFIQLFLRKFYYFWWFSPQSGITYPVLFKLIYQVYYVLILIGVIICTSFIGKQNKIFYDKLFLLAGVLVSISFLQSIFYVEIRHRWGIEPLLLIFSEAGWAHLYNRNLRFIRQVP